MEFKNKLAFDSQDKDKKAVKLCVKRPDTKQSTELEKVWNKAYQEAIANGALISKKIEGVARSQGVWSDELEEKVKQLDAEIKAKVLALLKGGMTKSAGKALAKKIAELRGEKRDILSGLDEITANTAERKAQNIQFNHLVALCTLWAEGPNEGKPYFENYQNYIERFTAEEQAAFDAGRYMGFLIHNLDPNFELNLPENRFLVEHKFADEKGYLINKEGKRVDWDGRLVNEKGQLINENGELVDRDGIPVDEKGNYIVEKGVFLDDPE
jgi:hypothetical protein